MLALVTMIVRHKSRQMHQTYAFLSCLLSYINYYGMQNLIPVLSLMGRINPSCSVTATSPSIRYCARCVSLPSMHPAHIEAHFCIIPRCIRIYPSFVASLTNACKMEKWAPYHTK